MIFTVQFDLGQVWAHKLGKRIFSGYHVNYIRNRFLSENTVLLLF